MLKDKINQLLDLLIGKVVDLIIIKVQNGELDPLLSAKVDEVVGQIVTTTTTTTA